LTILVEVIVEVEMACFLWDTVYYKIHYYTTVLAGGGSISKLGKHSREAVK